jgi:hypothetical protein
MFAIIVSVSVVVDVVMDVVVVVNMEKGFSIE